ncbi:MAG: penicillin-insensitive murein endopeptidase [Rubrimonas sp.]|uniref:penicillin-insensitive murein endopeptidase n=1 Tax=Rubrimonas sp. TaxID=2036015 RepID=UPI002FDD7FEF
MRAARQIAAATLCATLIASAAQADLPAKTLFGAAAAPSGGPASAHGAHAAGCLAGAVALPETGPGWQAMRLSRNRLWGHPAAIATVERLAAHARAIGWPGLLVGDISQPRGGPMVSGHSSHQIGLDIDIWLTEPPARPLSRRARETMGAQSVVAPDRMRVSDRWTPRHAALLRAAAEAPGVARIFVNAAIKAELCRGAGPQDASWLRRVRPWWGHDAHFHIRLACPEGAAGCVDQAPPPEGSGCDASLDWWFSDEALSPPPPAKPLPPRPVATLADLPPACADILAAP